jgi:PilZ domain
MAWLEMPHELRRAMRVRSKGSVQIRRGARIIGARVVDLAVGGICVRTDIAIGLVGVIGEPVRIHLRLDAVPPREFALLGHVLRASAATNLVALRFDALPADFEDWIQDELLAAVEHDALPRMILVDSPGARRRMIANAFRNAGCHVTEASMPLDAIAQLGLSRFEPDLIAIADSVPEAVAEELRAFLLEEHPEAHMVAIGSSSTRRAPAESWLRSSNGSGDLQTRVGRVMVAHGSRRRSAIVRTPSLRGRRGSHVRPSAIPVPRPRDRTTEPTS